MNTVPVAFEIVSLAVIVLILIGDIVLAFRRPRVPSNRESTLWVVFYVVLALIFGGVLLVVDGPTHATEFIAGWLTEYSLSIDNLFVFIVIMAGFAVPKQRQQEVLMIGIILALIFRGIFILIGAQLIENFSWIFYLFGAFLLYTAFTQAFGGDHGDQTDTALIRFAKRHLSVTDEYDGGRIRTTIDGKKMFTPILIVLIAIGATDVLFALDSIPAIFGITDSPFIVYTANIFALMGLRQLYFLLGDLVERLKYLKYGIAFILAFIGVKLILHALHENELPFLNGGEHITAIPEIGTGLSLGVIVLSMAVATGASLISIKRDPNASFSDLKAGSGSGSGEEEEQRSGERALTRGTDRDGRDDPACGAEAQSSTARMRVGGAALSIGTVLSGLLGRIRKRVARRWHAPERHLLGFGRDDAPPSRVRLPRHPSQLLGTDAWSPIAQLADQRIRAHGGERLSVGEMVETVSHEVEDAVASQPLELSFVAWRTWAAVTETPWPDGFHELLVGVNTSEADEVEMALHVQSDLAALLPQVVAARLSENGA